jgi:hypothetical protein
MQIDERAGQIADRYMPQIRFTYAGFYDSDTSPFPAFLHLEIPTAMLREYASLVGKEMPSHRIFWSRFLFEFWHETGLAKKLMAHEDVNKIPSNAHESPSDMLEYLIGDNVCFNLSPIPAKRDLESASIEIEIQDIPNLSEDEQA